MERIKFNFTNAKHKVEKYMEHNKRSSHTIKRSTVDNQLEPLTPEERKSLMYFFEGFHKLDQKKSALSLKLTAVAPNEEVLISPELDPTLKRKVRQSLHKINWDKNEVKLFKRLENYPSDAGNLFGWKNWQQSPFSVFYEDQHPWMEDMQGWSTTLNVQQKREKQDRQRCSFSSIGFGGKRNTNSRSCAPPKQEYKKIVQHKKDVIEMHIASWLLQKMGQLTQD
ncbi:hypothetical protein [Candidatus Mycoplasma haematominutum]|nr:hypothetical protein [Candidatus Mycoplasma haematominutum]